MRVAKERKGEVAVRRNVYLRENTYLWRAESARNVMRH